MSTLLICTVGGTPAPIVTALKHWKPARVLFVHTPQSKLDVDAKVLPMAQEVGVDLDAGRYDFFEVPDGQDLTGCLDRLREVTPLISAWTARGTEFRVVVDFTGGTKCMSSAVALQASRWPCVFSYVGGDQRTKEGVGIVVSGTERVVHQANPWDALGRQAVEDFVVLFDQHAFISAANVASVTMRRVSDAARKAELAVLERLAAAMDAWDRFDHTKSRNLLGEVAKSANNLKAALGMARADTILRGADTLAAHLDQVCRSTPPSRHHVLDLLANAKRRKDEGRFDDALARLYRAIEAIAQLALKERHGVDSTEKVLLANVPAPLRNAWTSRAQEGTVTLGLQNAYLLLEALNDPLGPKFQHAGLGGATSPLVARNRSILAHGYERVSNDAFERLWTSALSLADVDPETLPSFPSLVETRVRA